MKAAGLSNTKAKEVYGIGDFQNRKERLEDALTHAKAIRESVEKIARLKDKGLLASLGFEFDTESDPSDTESESDPDDQMSQNEEPSANNNSLLSDSAKQSNTESDGQYQSNRYSSMHKPQEFQLDESSDECFKHQSETSEIYMNSHQVLDILKSCSFNWFAFVMALKSKLTDITDEALNQLLLDFGGQLSFMDLDESDLDIAERSRQAFLLSERKKSINDEEGIVLSESDSSDQEMWNQGINNILGKSGREIVKKQREAIHRKAVRDAKRKIMEQRFLKKKRSKKVSQILTEIPEIGKEIENFVMECGAGADAWRRTGVITFDGNRKMQKKPTFKRVKEHLEEKFKIKISYGSVVQLCIARNRRRRSASRYKGVAKVLQKRARKGFTFKFNPDEHWSAAFYQSLNDQQFRDGEKVLNLGRDDQAGFRLDTMTTHKLHGTLSVKGHESLTTRTDYVNGYPPTLQVTSYNFPETENTAERCVGVVKARPLHEKNAAQHLADLELLSTKEILKPVFF